MANAPRDRKAMGVWLDLAVHLEAERIAAVADLRKSQVIRLAIAAGLPLVAEHFAPPSQRFDPIGGGED